MNSTNLLKLADRFEKTLEKKAEEEDDLKDQAKFLGDELGYLGSRQSGLKDEMFEASLGLGDKFKTSDLRNEFKAFEEKIIGIKFEMDEILEKIQEITSNKGADISDDGIPDHD